MESFQKADTTIIKVKHGKHLYSCYIKIPELIPGNGIHVIYGLKDPRNGQVYYIGRTREFLIRIRAHCKVYLHNRLTRLERRKLDIFFANLLTECILLHTCSSEEEAISVEYTYIQKHKNELLNTQIDKFDNQPIKPGWLKK